MFEFEKHNIMILNNTLGECEKRYNNIRSAYVYKKMSPLERMLFKIHEHVYRGVKAIGMEIGNLM